MREMKDSGVEWIGDIPYNWHICASKYVVSINNGSDPQSDSGNIPVYGSGGKSFKSCSEFKEGPAVLLGRKGTVNIPHWIEERYWNVDTAFDVKSKGDFSLKFYYYLACCFDYDRYTTQTALPSMTQATYNNIQIPCPPLEVQTRIADFLDEKCDKIDSIIERQQAVIDKLKAYKLSVITEAVTKGLNPDVEMKDSGIEWIGEIPKDYKTIKLKYFVKVSDGTHDTPSYVGKTEDTYPLVTSRCIEDGHINTALANNISKEDYDEINKRSNVDIYDVIMPMIGTVGNPAIVEIEPNFAIKNVALLRTDKNLIKAKLVFYWLSSESAQKQFDIINRGGVQNFISQDKLRNLVFVLPANIEEVISYLDEKTMIIDKNISILSKLIDRLDQYKKSLIYEVVTGKKEV